MTNPSTPGTGPFGLPGPPLQAAWPPRPKTQTHPPDPPTPPINEFKAHTPTQGEGTPVRLAVRWFLFEACRKLLHGGTELSQLLLNVLTSIWHASIRSCKFLFETLERLRDVLLKLLDGIVEDRKWFIIFLTAFFWCWVSYANHGILWKMGEVIGSHVCALGQCSNTTSVATPSNAPTTQPNPAPEPEPATRSRRGRSFTSPP